MTRKLVGALSALALLSGGMAFAGGNKSDRVDTQSTMRETTTVPEEGIGGSGSAGSTTGEEDTSTGGTGGSGELGTSGSQMDTSTGGSGQMGQQTGSQQGQQELTGKVVKASKKTVWVEASQGAVVALTVNNQTQIQGGDAKRAQDLKEGQEIRASFDVKQTDNVARMIEVNPAAQGGSGFESEGSPYQDIPSSGSPTEQGDPGTGGSGTESGSTIDPSLDPSLRNPQTVPDTGESRGPASPMPEPGQTY